MQATIRQGQKPKPGIYVNVLDNCPQCGGRGTASIILTVGGKDTGSLCQLCGGSGMMMGLMPFDQALLVVLDALGLLTEEQKATIAQRIRDAAIRLVQEEGAIDK